MFDYISRAHSIFWSARWTVHRTGNIVSYLRQHVESSASTLEPIWLVVSYDSYRKNSCRKRAWTLLYTLKQWDEETFVITCNIGTITSSNKHSHWKMLRYVVISIENRKIGSVKSGEFTGSDRHKASIRHHCVLTDMEKQRRSEYYHKKLVQ